MTITSSHLISSRLSPLTSAVIGAPQMTLQQYICTLPCLPLPSGNLQTHSHLFFCLPLLLVPVTVPCRIVFAMPEELKMWSYHLSFLFFTMVRRSSCTPITFWILLRTSLFVRHMVFVGNIQKSPIASHLKGLDPSLDFCCQGPALTGIKEGR